MRSLLIVVLLFVFSSNMFAQIGINSVQADFTGIATINNFTNHELVAPSRRNRTGFGDEWTANAYVLIGTAVPRLSIRTGLGYRERNFYMSKYTIDQFFLAIFGVDTRDSFKVSDVRIVSHYLNLPCGFSYRLTVKKQRVQFHGGVQLNAGFGLDRHARLNFDETYLTPTAAEREDWNSRYESTESNFMLSIQPRIDMDICIFKGGGIQLGLFPLIFYMNSQTRLANSVVGFGSTMGVFYKF